jgi:hypothetical protein
MSKPSLLSIWCRYLAAGGCLIPVGCLFGLPLAVVLLAAWLTAVIGMLLADWQ